MKKRQIDPELSDTEGFTPEMYEVLKSRLKTVPKPILIIKTPNDDSWIDKCFPKETKPTTP